MKMHWGHSIFVFYLFFVATLVVVVVKSRTFDNSLVTEAYYERDINYQQEYDRKYNSKQLSSPVALVENNGTHQLHFPSQKADDVTGTVLLYRPSSKDNDRLLQLSVSPDGTMPLDTRGMKPGKYTAVVIWDNEGEGYYDELPLQVQP